MYRYLKLLLLLTILGFLAATLGVLYVIYYSAHLANVDSYQIRFIGSILLCVFSICYIWGKRISQKIDEENRKSVHSILWFFRNQPLFVVGEILICAVLLLLL